MIERDLERRMGMTCQGAYGNVHHVQVIKPIHQIVEGTDCMQTDPFAGWLV